MLMSKNLLPILAMSAAIAMTASASADSFVATQSAGEQSTSSLIGLKVENDAGDNLGDINYLVLDSTGKVTTAVIGVGGFLGVGEKNVGLPFGEVKLTNNKDGKRIAMIAATKDTLTAAPSYVWTEKSTMQQLKEDASVLAAEAKKAASDMSESAKASIKQKTE